MWHGIPNASYARLCRLAFYQELSVLADLCVHLIQIYIIESGLWVVLKKALFYGTCVPRVSAVLPHRKLVQKAELVVFIVKKQKYYLEPDSSWQRPETQSRNTYLRLQWFDRENVVQVISSSVPFPTPYPVEENLFVLFLNWNPWKWYAVVHFLPLVIFL